LLGEFGELKVIHLDSARALDFDELLERDDDLPDIVGWIRVGSDGSIAEPLEVGRCAQQPSDTFSPTTLSKIAMPVGQGNGAAWLDRD